MTTRLFTEEDRYRLGHLLLSEDARGTVPWHYLDELEWQLETTRATEPSAIPDDIVTMNSTVRLVSADGTQEALCTIVYPEDIELTDMAISVLEPLGSRLLGRRVGDLIEWKERAAEGPWLVAEVVFQPERVGKFLL
ncbi:GreA/GreB family elongation factor [Aeoliella sp. SH292]|uniref:GreA/GreB family elongation factor n=1 Tax=Aeoliella sp. SH292 TaxID=3454464 RepID=UPI003F9D7378